MAKSLCASCRESDECDIKKKYKKENSHAIGYTLGVINCTDFKCKRCGNTGKYTVHDGSGFYGDSHSHTYDCDCEGSKRLGNEGDVL